MSMENTMIEQDVYSFGFDKTLARQDVSQDSSLVYNAINGLLQLQQLQSSGGVILSSGGTSMQSQNFSKGATGWKLDSNGNFFTLPISRLSTAFETAARFSQVVSGSGSTAFGTYGLVLATGATQSSTAYNSWLITSVSVFIGNPQFTALVEVRIVAGGNNERYIGLGDVGNIPSYTTQHAGFKIIGSSLYATQGDGTTETASSSLTILANSDLVALQVKINSSSIEYSYRVNNGSFVLGATLTTNMPNSASSYASMTSYNVASATDIGLRIHGASYER